MKIKARCQQQVTIDAKGRIALPARIRTALEEMGVASLVLTGSPSVAGASVWAWTESDYQATIEAPMDGLDPFRTDVQIFTHSVMASAQDVEVDNQGRIRIPPPLRDHGCLVKECVVFVVMGHIEIWDRVSWEQREVTARGQQQARQHMPRQQGAQQRMDE